MSVLCVKEVTKRYDRVTAVDGVSFDAYPGRVFGLLGPNGAGKTSIIRMITYITAPDAGEIRFHDQPVGPASQNRMGYLPEEHGLYKKMKIGEQLRYLAELKGLDRRDAETRISYWLERFEAATWLDKKAPELSKGMQQKVQFIATVMHDPDLLIFDEPFSGLDPINSTLLRDVMFELKQAGKTILFASHRMEQVEQLCDDICLVSKGKAILQGSLRDIKRSFGQNTVLLDFDGPDTFLDDLIGAGHIQVDDRTKSHAEITVRDTQAARRVLETALQHVEVVRFELVELPLSDIFISVVEGQA